MTDKTATVRDDVQLGKDVMIWAKANLYGCSIGDETHIGAFSEVGRGAWIGKRCKIQSHVGIPDGTSIGDNVFIGPHVQFTNDRFPRATRPDGALKGPDDWACDPAIVCDYASIGAGAVILPGIEIGEGAMVGAGAVVTHSVRPWTVVAGNPARFLRKVTPEERGQVLRSSPAV